MTSNNMPYGARWFLGPLPHDAVITVSYARRFSRGKCLLAALIPAEKLTLGMIRGIGARHEGYHYPPILINHQAGAHLRLMYRLPDMRPDEHARLFECARALAAWARELFEMPAIISPINGLIEARWRFRAF